MFLPNWGTKSVSAWVTFWIVTTSPGRPLASPKAGVPGAVFTGAGVPVGGGGVVVSGGGVVVSGGGVVLSGGLKIGKTSHPGLATIATSATVSNNTPKGLDRTESNIFY